MKIIFDSKFERNMFIEKISESNVCPDYFGFREADNCFDCEGCWEEAFEECRTKLKEGAKENE